MHRNLDSTSELTEFAPLSPEDKSSFGLSGISKFFKLGRECYDNLFHKTGGDTQEKEKDNGDGKTENDWQPPSGSGETGANGNLEYPITISEGRSLPNVLKRISNLVALKNVGLTSYKDTDLKQYWMPDSFSKECYDCGEKFTTFRRRHHCRVCGQIFCSRCCNQEIPGKIMGCTGDLRVCTYCCKIVLSYLQSPDIGADLSADLRALQEDLQTKFGNTFIKNADNFQTGNVSSSDICEKGEASSSIRRKPSLGYQEEIFVMGRAQSPSYLTEEERCRALQNSASLRNLYEEIIRPPDGIQLQSHRYRFRSFSNCFFGSELVDWLIAQNKSGTRIQGVAIGQALLEAGYLESVGDTTFVDGLSLYRPVSLLTPNSDLSTSSESQEPLWVKEIQQQDSRKNSVSEPDRLSEIEEEPLQKSSSNYLLNINVKDSIVHVSRPSPPLQDSLQNSEKSTLRPGKQSETIQGKINNLGYDNNDVMLNTSWDKTSNLVAKTDGEDPSHLSLTSAFEHHKQSLLRQMLSVEGLSQSWSDTIQDVVSGVVDLVRPDMKNDEDEMDIRLYVQVKKLPGGLKSDTNIVSGVVCSKHVAHRSMRSRITNPRILLLRCSVAYERIEGRLLPLEPVIMQEHEYLRHVVARIAALQPDIVMVYKNVSRLAQEYLLKLGITLVINTKLSILERVSRFTQADIVTSIDAHVNKPQLGTCQLFHLKSYQTENGGMKTLMFFEGSYNPTLGCSLLLRGGTISELKKVKKIVNFMVFACYNWKLEKAFLMDEFAKPPNTPFLLFEESPDQDFKSAEVALENKIEMKAKVEKEDKKITVEAVQDCSDPLQSYLNHSDDGIPKQVENSPMEQLSVTELPFSNKFRKSLDDTILSVSLYVKYSVPYLETESGRNCILRKYFPKEIYYSKQFLDKNELNRPGVPLEHTDSNSLEYQLKGIKLLPKHPFITVKITDTANSVEVQTLLALFRANGGRIPMTLSDSEKKELRENSKNQVNNVPVAKKSEILDVLDPVNHQRLPVVVNMYFYGTYDIPLGSFLERYCFRSSYVCPSETCNTPMLEHVRRFVHDPGSVYLTVSHLEQLDCKQIVMWSWCPKCQTATPMIPMSSETWSLSFAKYLELRFRGEVYTRRDSDTCKHSLHHDHYQYFGMNKIVALFKFSTVHIWEICLPPPVINLQLESPAHSAITDELRNIAIKGHDIYSSILERIHNLEGSEEDIQAMKHLQQKEHAHFKAKIEEIQLKLTSPVMENKKSESNKSDREVEFLLWRIDDSVVYLKRLISEAVIEWNVRFLEAANAVKKKDDKERDKTKRASEGSWKLGNQISVTEGHETESKEEEYGDDALLEITNNSTRNLSDSATDSLDVDSDDNVSTRLSTSDTCDHDKVGEDVKSKKSNSETLVNCDECQLDSKHDKKTVKNILSQILTSNKDYVPLQSPWNQQEHFMLGSNANIMVHENEPSSIISYALASHDYQRYFDEIQQKKLQVPLSSESQIPSPSSRRKTLSLSSSSDKETDNSDSRRTNVLSFLRGNNQGGPSQTSASTRSCTESTQSIMNTSSSSDIGNTNTLDVDEKPDEGLKKSTKGSSSSHVEVIFGDSTTNFYCHIYFAEQFANLRQSVFPIGEEAFVRSLSRCVHWAARGGKSGSTFCKTKDDRFILKEMSRLELQLFLEFANHYFSYIQKCQESNQPTLLGKIVGVYTVSFRNTSSNSTLKCNLLVMENLFYKKNVAQKYDLKGSVRNRLVNPSLQGEGEIVYLDENLLQMTTDSPLYILSHSQTVLMRAIESDTQFLAAQTVMDYSLLVGLGEDRKELVIGIIDYIRTFTWDKKLETMVKKSVIMGGQGKQPTVIQPKDYRDRFIAAMHRYFLPVPDRWTGLDKTNETRK
ncbi:hypothetical protein RUM43_001934 [Polyplax serrata]|uniref:1-phosphatidylinositol-3-phosphate 5-kinase n=1 Tax=Polyplax serrata TaxID=468196 RepID=A0AAN8XR72_POLSC